MKTQNKMKRGWIPQHRKQVSIEINIDLFFSVMTIMKTTVGVGIVSLPYTFSRLGWLLSFFLFIVSITLIQFTIILLLKSKNLSRHSNYTSIGHHALEGTKFEKWTRSICSFAILFNNLGVCII